MSAPTLLITRTQPKAAAFAALMQAGGWQPMLWPLLEIHPVPAAVDGSGAQAVLFTSAHAVRAMPATTMGKRPPMCLCVGEATALIAREAGYGGAVAADGDAAALTEAVRQRLTPSGGPLLFLRGEAVAGDLAQPLRDAGFTVQEHVVYRADVTDQVPPMLGAMLDTGRISAVTLHSPRGARAFAAFAQRAGWRLAKTQAVCISQRAAAPLDALTLGGVTVASTADDSGMAAAVRTLLPRPPCQ